jgi:hypothetical protein
MIRGTLRISVSKRCGAVKGEVFIQLVPVVYADQVMNAHNISYTSARRMVNARLILSLAS